MEIQAASLSEKALLGQGYDVRKEEFVGRCVRGDVGYAGPRRVDGSMDQGGQGRDPMDAAVVLRLSGQGGAPSAICAPDYP